jgi:sodium transport system permease protein
MNFNIIKAVFIKEVTDTLRDSKTLVIMILLPIILYPLISIGAGQILIKQGKKIQENVVSIHIDKKDNGLYKFFSENKKVKLVDSKNPEEDLKNGKINAFLKLDKDFNSEVKKEKITDVNLYYDQANLQSLNAYTKITEQMKEYRKQVVEERVSKKGLNKELLTPFLLYYNNIAPKERVGGFYLGSVLPFLIILMTILGAFYPAIDQTAGEKERGTLETLLTTPAGKNEIITGKFLTVSLFAFLTGFLNLGSMVLSMNMLLQSDKIDFSIPWDSMLLIFITLIPTTLFFVAIMMLVASLANSFKDAQNYLTPVYIICGFPAMVTIFPGIELDFKTALIPIANVSLLFKELLLSHFQLDSILLVLITTTIYSIIAISLAAKLFMREDVIFSDESSIRLLFSSEGNKYNKTPNFLEVITLYIVTFGLLFYVGSELQTSYKLNGLIMTEIFLVMLPALLFTRYLKFDYKETLSLKKVSLYSLLGSSLLAFSGSFFVSKFVFHIQDKFMPMPDELKEAFKFILTENGEPVSAIKIFIAVAISAAICEEFLFRGPILSGIKSKFSKKSSIIIVGILFGLFHMNLYRFIPTSLLGMLITYIVISTGSILNGILFHLINNGSAVVLSNGEKGLLWLDSNSPIYYYPIFFIIFILGIYFIKKSKNNA